MKACNGKHDRAIDWLVERLLSKGYECVERNVEYNNGYVAGELDVMTFRNGNITYYEVKTCRDDKRAFSKALQQFQRAKGYYKGERLRFVYVSPYGVRRVRL